MYDTGLITVLTHFHFSDKRMIFNIFNYVQTLKCRFKNIHDLNLNLNKFFYYYLWFGT